MASRISWIDVPPGRLAIMARPRSGDWLNDEISGWKAERIQLVISLLEHHEIAELGLQSEPRLCEEQGIEFLSFPISDRGVPQSMRDTAELTQNLKKYLAEGRTLAIHCRVGIGRSSLIAACTLVRCGFGVADAFETIAKARGLAVPDTDEQRGWVGIFENFNG